MTRWLRRLVLALLPLLGGCASLDYYWQATSGHLSLLHRPDRSSTGWLKKAAHRRSGSACS